MVEESKENLKENQEKFKNFGFDLYPDRRSVDNETYTNNDLALNKKVRNHCTKVCEKNVMLAIKKSE